MYACLYCTAVQINTADKNETELLMLGMSACMHVHIVTPSWYNAVGNLHEA